MPQILQRGREVWSSISILKTSNCSAGKLRTTLKTTLASGDYLTMQQTLSTTRMSYTLTIVGQIVALSARPSSSLPDTDGNCGDDRHTTPMPIAKSQTYSFLVPVVLACRAIQLSKKLAFLFRLGHPQNIITPLLANQSTRPLWHSKAFCRAFF